ncbi:MAG TPA: TonB-dependent siderophore receptor [Nevskiaceae bacterium]|nr:TonB-dependent siderophore receptor [Nevskiaceae bacterium]
MRKTTHLSRHPALNPIAATLLMLGSVGTANAAAPTIIDEAAAPPRSTRAITHSSASSKPATQLASTQLHAIEVQAPNEGYSPSTATLGPLHNTPLQDVPQSVTVVDHQLMQAQGATNFQDALRYVPGITFAAAEGGAIGNNINLRGFNARTDVYLDGFRDRGQYYRDTFSLDSIDVLQGPSSMLFGRGSTGGIVNQVSKTPSWIPHDVVQATLGTNDQYRFTGDFDHAINDSAAFRIPVMAQTVHSTRDVMHGQDYGAAPSLRLRPNEKTELTFTSLLEHNHDMPDYGLPPLNGHPAPVPRDTFYGLTSDHTTQDVQLIAAQLRYHALPNLTLRNNAQYVRYRIDAIETAPGMVGTCSTQPCTSGNFSPLRTAANPGSYTHLPLSGLYVRLGSHARDIRDTSAYDQFDATWKFRTGPLRHKLIVGGELGRETYRNQALQYGNLPYLPLLNPPHLSEDQAGVTLTAAGQNLAQASATSYAGYFNDTISIGKHWKLVGGLRWDRYDAQLTNTVPSSRNPASADQTVYHDSVRSGILYQPTETQTWYVSYGTSFDPALETLTVRAGQQALPPETSRSLEVGTKQLFLDGNLSVDLAGFQVRQDNTAVQVATGVYEPEGSIRVNGGEISFSGRLTPKWQVFGGYTYLDGKLTDPAPGATDAGNKPENTPRHNATLWTDYAFTQTWSAGTGVVWQSSRYANVQNTVSVPSFVRWDATVAYTRPKYDIRLNLLNLSNVHYFDNLIQSDGGRAVPGLSRSALVTVTYHFD